MNLKLLLISASLLSFVASLNLVIGIATFSFAYLFSTFLFGLSALLQWIVFFSENRKKRGIP